MTTVTTTASESTCGDDCWEARGDICQCSCGGRNHGVLRDGAYRPDRTRRVGQHRYRLIGSTSWFGLEEYYQYHTLIWNKATPTQLQWSEVKPAAEERAARGKCVGDCETYLVWELVEE